MSFASFLILFLTFACFSSIAHGKYNNTCVSNPSNSSCIHFQLPSNVIDEDVNKLCSMMGNMSGCAVNRICSTPKYKSGTYCNNFSILKELCQDMDMPGGCSEYSSMCESGSAVEQCQMKSLPIPSSMDTAKLIHSICDEMVMPGCEKCTGKGMVPCDVLQVYSDLCKSMPEMAQCADWNNICTLVPSWPICNARGSNTAPEMRMYFHTGFADYILFEQWVPRNGWQYALTWLLVFFLTVIYDGLKLFKNRLERKWAIQHAKNKVINEPSCHDEGEPLHEAAVQVPPFRLEVDLTRALLQFLEVGLGYGLMLVAMTFNVGLFFAICLGAFAGSLLFGRFLVGGGSSSSHH